MDKDNLKKQMERSIEHLEQELKTLQIGRASTGLVESIDIFIEEWGMKQPINQLANIGILDAQTIKIEPWDKNRLKNIETGIYDSGLGLTPQNMGDYIMIKIPLMTQERRGELSKLVNKIGEEAKISIRNNRHEALRDIKKLFDNKEISEDDKNKNEKEIDDLTKDYNNQIDNKMKVKTEEIMKI